MNVETGGIGAVVAAPVMPGLGRGLDSFGPAIGPVGLPINEGPAGFAGLALEEKIMPTSIGQADPVVEIRFNSPLAGIVPVEPAASNPFLSPEVQSESKPTEQRIIKEAVYWFTDVAGSKVVKPAEVIMPQTVPARVAQPVDSWVTPATAPQTGLEEEEIEEVTEQVAQQEEEADSNEIEDTEISKTKIVESVQISKERRSAIKVAVREALRLGITVKKALPDRFWELISPLVKGKKDWTVVLTADELNINPAEFSSAEKAEEVSVGSVANNVPLEEGEDGKQATVGQVRKVTHGEDDKLKPKTPAEIVKKRIIKKKAVVSKARPGWAVIENKAETTQENTLKELNLEDVFQRAA